MCGITGFISEDIIDSREVIRAMTKVIAHRGPDYENYWISNDQRIALGHRRLSIIDLSHDGNQPMVSACGRYIIIFNGEIYNFIALRSELKSIGYQFRGHSDTEVMLAAIAKWGLTDAVKRFNGMFAFALLDKKTRQLFLVRDRLGIKPLYYGWCGKVFLFGSELKSLRNYPSFSGEIDRDALHLYWQHNYIPAPYCIYQNCYKLLPGTILTIDITKPYLLQKSVAYWSAIEIANQPVIDISLAEATDRLNGLLCDAVKLRMVADVPIGAFLSGGVDSSLVTALMQAQSNQKVKTFSIGFFEEQYNEAEFAKNVARHLGTEHTELYVSSREAIEVIPHLPIIFDEPFADSSQIPTFLVSQLTRNNVTVSLSGDGGDELFAGYNRYFRANNIWRKIRFIPTPILKTMSFCLQSIPVEAWDKFFVLLPNKYSVALTGNRVHKFTEILSADKADDLYYRLITLGSKLDNCIVDRRLLSVFNSLDRKNFIERMMFWDMLYYLPDDILTKVDRASMAVSLEARVPILDHRIVELSWQLPLALKACGGNTKKILRDILYRYVPKKLIERPKKGFALPVAQWLRNELRDWAEDLLDEKKLQQSNYLDLIVIKRRWQEHISGKRNWHAFLWRVLMFQAWLKENE